MEFGQLRRVGDGSGSRGGTPVEGLGNFSTKAKQILLGEDYSFKLAEMVNWPLIMY